MKDYKSINADLFRFLSGKKPYAVAEVSGGKDYPTICGIVEFYLLEKGAIVVASIEKLPTTATNIFAFHIHNGETCNDNFAESGTHFNPTNQEHPNHVGDMPPLFSNNGEAWTAFLDQRFNVQDIIGKVVIIHDNPDDFTTQPSGNSGNKIACGIIEKL